MNLFLDITGSHEQQDYELGIGVGLEKMADLHLEGHFSNVPIEIFEFEKYDDSELESILSEKWTKIGVVKLLARYDERGFLEYSMGKFSTESGFSKAAIARQVSQQFENTATRYNLSGSEEMASELEKFVLEPKTLRIGFLPEDPLNFRRNRHVGSAQSWPTAAEVEFLSPICSRINRVSRLPVDHSIKSVFGFGGIHPDDSYSLSLVREVSGVLPSALTKSNSLLGLRRGGIHFRNPVWVE